MSGSISATELADIKARASSIVTPWAGTVLRLVAEVERLSVEAERFEGMWRMECGLAASKADVLP